MVDASLRATILETLRNLNLEYDISFLYITHDLTTAYQVSDNILVMYQGRVVETGAVEPTIKESRHPYTQLLVSSIPLPDPDHRWGQDMIEADEEAEQDLAGRDRCLFAPRCPHVMPVCRQAAPPMFRPRPHQASACYLETEGREGPPPEVMSGDITQAFAPAATQQRPPNDLHATVGQKQGR